MGRWFEVVAMFVLATFCSVFSEEFQKTSRQKRILWITTDGRLALPPGTLLTITPTISMPFVRYPPDGFLSNMTISLPFTINFDMLGLTDNQNPYGALPPLIARGLGKSAGSFFADYLATLISSRRHSRDTSQPPDMPPLVKNLFHGGERGLLYVIVEDFLSNFGMDGKACLLRAICEVNGYSLKQYGLFGEIIKLFFTASKSPYSEVLNEYVKAERQGTEKGECFPYFKDCPKSLFATEQKNKYIVQETEHNQENNDEELFLNNEIPNVKSSSDNMMEELVM
ncbi:hypothetical protein O3M35_003729 [Rhynocoris fuscipes]|uniref:Uncharacterized protein n=1 Tax=Rhynocoris fuscipes TaxID=488301 RepID=A0AAW1CHG8_9HEMI